MLDMKYFVLKPRSKGVGDRFAAASRKAMRAYANHIRRVDEQMANELIAWAQKESDKEFEMKALQSIGRKKS
uniref:Uncharacterized protein n=1 Tax=viral metagenome TaxID=1070528 RepID=A0A6M3L9L0_9ZZZZ